MQYGTKINRREVPVDVYFAPLACSMATRIALYEAGAEARFIQVDTRAKRLADGSDFLAVNAMGQVPVVRTDDGALLTENPVVLQYVADRHPGSGLAPAGGTERYRVQQWLSFVASELHKLVFTPLLDPKSGDGAKAYAHEKAAPRLAFLDAHLEGREHLLDRFTVADAYLVTVLNWARFCGVDLAPYPAVQAYVRRLGERPSVGRAMTEEFALYKEEQARRAAR
jgi:glutathione S-transferase